MIYIKITFENENENNFENDFDNNIYWTVDYLTETNNKITGSNNITLRKVNVKQNLRSLEVGERDIQACHYLKKDNDRRTVKFTNKKVFLKVLRRKNQFKSINPSLLDHQKGIIVSANESLCSCYGGT